MRNARKLSAGLLRFAATISIFPLFLASVPSGAEFVAPPGGTGATATVDLENPNYQISNPIENSMTQQFFFPSFASSSASASLMAPIETNIGPAIESGNASASASLGGLDAGAALEPPSDVNPFDDGAQANASYTKREFLQQFEERARTWEPL